MRAGMRFATSFVSIGASRSCLAGRGFGLRFYAVSRFARQSAGKGRKLLRFDRHPTEPDSSGCKRSASFSRYYSTRQRSGRLVTHESGSRWGHGAHGVLKSRAGRHPRRAAIGSRALRRGRDRAGDLECGGWPCASRLHPRASGVGTAVRATGRLQLRPVAVDRRRPDRKSVV